MLRKNLFFCSKSLVSPKLVPARFYAKESKLKTYSVTGFAEKPGVPVQFKTSAGLPIAVGDGAPSPLEYILASLTGCEVATARFWAKKLGIEIGAIKFTKVEGEIDFAGFYGEKSENPLHLRSVSMTVEVETAASAEKLRELQNIVQEKCPVAAMFNAAKIPIRAEWKKI